MSERYNVSASAVLGENYKITSVECSDYNPSIDSTITVTISVNDVYGDAISGESVTVTASEGTFTQRNGSNITAASSVTGTTNSSGQFTLTYSCSEWGLITFTANNTSTQIKVKGWKQVQTYLTGRLTVYTDGRNGFLKINGAFYPASTNHLLETISECKPLYHKIVMASDVYAAGQGQYQDIIRFLTSGELYIVSNGSGTHNVYTSILYPLANPLY